jgi:hypothetical protein
MALKAGTVDDFEDSMAEAIENALKVEWAVVKEIAFPTTGEDDRRLLFVAIAQGIVRYLKDNAEASIVVHSVSVTQDSTNNVGSSGSTGPASAGVAHTHSVSVTQTSGSANRVESSGDGKVRIVTTGDLH